MLRGFAANRCVLWLERWLQARGVGKAPQRCIIPAFSWWMGDLDLPVPNKLPAMAAEEWPSSDQVRRRTSAISHDVAMKSLHNVVRVCLPVLRCSAEYPLPSYRDERITEDFSRCTTVQTPQGPVRAFDKGLDPLWMRELE